VNQLLLWDSEKTILKSTLAAMFYFGNYW